MRMFLVCLEDANLADLLQHRSSYFSSGRSEFLQAYDTVIDDLRKFRMGHKKVVLPYLDLTAPERMPMTAGGGMVNTERYGDGVDDNWVQRDVAPYFQNRLEERQRETVNPLKAQPRFACLRRMKNSLKAKPRLARKQLI